MKINLKCLVLIIVSFFIPPAFAQDMPTGRYTSIPIGHFEFCQRYPGECRPVFGSKTPLNFSPELMERIQDINIHVNNEFVPMLDIDIYGQDEFWAYPQNAADCEDYALEKRRRLMEELGISPANLLMTVVFRISHQEAHAVLTLRTNKGDYILDNLSDEVVLWTRLTDYKFTKRQSVSHSARWVEITPSKDIIATSIVK